MKRGIFLSLFCMMFAVVLAGFTSVAQAPVQKAEIQMADQAVFIAEAVVADVVITVNAISATHINQAIDVGITPLIIDSSGGTAYAEMGSTMTVDNKTGYLDAIHYKYIITEGPKVNPRIAYRT